MFLSVLAHPVSGTSIVMREWDRSRLQLNNLFIYYALELPPHTSSVFAHPVNGTSLVMRDLDSRRLQFNDIFTYSALELNPHKFSFENEPATLVFSKFYTNIYIAGSGFKIRTISIKN